jgi:hypothetical protein
MSAWASSSIADSKSPFLNASFQAEPTSPSDARLLLQGNLAEAAEVTITLRLPPELSLSSGQLVQVSTIGQGGLVLTEWSVDASQDGYYPVELVINVEFDDPDDAILYGTTVSFNQYLEFSGDTLTHSGEEPLGQYTARGLTDEQIFTHGDAEVYTIGEEALGQEVMAGWIVVNVSGRVVYNRPEECYSQDRTRGVPGVLVYLDWDGGSSPDQMYTPYNGGGIEGIAFARTDMNGNFRFLFQFYSAIPAYQYVSFISVYSTRDNAATKNYRYPDDRYFVERDVINISTAEYLVQDNAVQVTTPLNDGAALRSLYRSRQYSIDVLGYTPPFLRHYIWGSGTTAYWSNGDGHAGVRHIDFTYVPYGDPAYHEYGHFIDDMWGGLKSDSWDDDHWFERVTDWGTAWKEGWAEYFSAVVYEHYYASELTAVDLTEWDSVYQFLDRYNAQARLDGLSPGTDRTKVEGAVATYLYSLHDKYTARANGYVGDNDDVDLGPSALLNACTNAEAQTLGSIGLVSKLNDLVKEQVSTTTATSVQALYDFYVLDTGFPRPATPTVMSASDNPAPWSLTWNNNGVQSTVTVPGQCNYPIDIYYPNVPTGYGIYRRLTEQVWDGTLTGYELLLIVPYGFAWTDPSPRGVPTSYVVAAHNAAGMSAPRAETRFVPPAYFDVPINGAEVSGVIDIVGTLNAQSSIRGFAVSAPYDSFGVYWGSGPTPSTWHRYGISYSIYHGSTVSHGTIGTWNTGVVPAGTYILRLIAYYGSSSYETRRQVTVTHRATVVAAGGSIRSAMEWAEVGDTIRVSEGVYGLSLSALDLKMSVQLMAANGVVEIRPVSQVQLLTATDLKYPPIITGITFKRTEPAFAPASYCIFLDASALTLRNCKFDGMQAWYGAAVKAVGPSNVRLENCEFTNTQRYETYLGSVVDMEANAEGKPTGAFIDCLFHDNAVPAASISYLVTNPLQGLEPKPYFDGCRFEANSSSEYLVKISNSSRTINFFSCSFVDNDLYPFDDTPSAMLYCDNAKVWLDNCTVADNSGHGADAGAVSIGSSGTSPVDIDDSIVAFNGGPVVNRTHAQMPADVTLERCIVFNNSAGSYRTDAQWASAGTEVFAENPAFCYGADEERYTLYAFSPAAAGLNGEPGPYFDERVGAFDVACVPAAVVTVGEGNEDYVSGPVLVGCPGGDMDDPEMDHLTISVDFDDAVMTRTIAASELSLHPPYLPFGLCSSDTIRGDTDATAPNYIMTLDHSYFSGYGANDKFVLYLNGYALGDTAVVDHRSFDMKSAGAPGPPACGTGDLSCPDGKVSSADFGWFSTHYRTSANPNAPYFRGADYAEPIGQITLADNSQFIIHYVGAGHKQPSLDPLLQTVGEEQFVATHVEFSFTEEYETALEHRLYADVTLEDCANTNWCVFAIRTNRPDMTLLRWEPTSWAAGSAPFQQVNFDGEAELVFSVFMINDTAESTRHLGRLVFDVKGSEPALITDGEFVLTFGEVELAGDQGGEALVAGSGLFARMSGVTGRVLNQTAQQIYHNRLEQNFPNPFNPQTTLAYSVKDASDVSLVIYDVAGRRVRELVNEHRKAGVYKVVWDGRDGKGTQVASGVYFYKLAAGSFVDTKKMIMLK